MQIGEYNGGDAPAQQEQGAEHSTSALAGACPAAAAAAHPLSWSPAAELHQHLPQGTRR